MPSDIWYLIPWYAFIGFVALTVVSGLFIAITTTINGSAAHAEILRDAEPANMPHHTAEHAAH